MSFEVNSIQVISAHIAGSGIGQPVYRVQQLVS